MNEELLALLLGGQLAKAQGPQSTPAGPFTPAGASAELPFQFGATPAITEQVSQEQRPPARQVTVQEPRTPIRQVTDQLSLSQIPIGPTELEKALQQQLNAEFAQSFARQDQGLNRLDRLITETKGRETSTDLRPLLAVADALSLNGKTLSDNQALNDIAKGFSQADKDALIAGLEVEAQKRRGAATNAIIQRLQTVGGRGSGINNQILTQLGQQQRFDTAQTKRLEDVATKPIQKITDDLFDKEQRFEQIDAAFGQGDLQSVMSQLGNFARVVSGEVGVLTDSDITRILPRSIQGDTAKIQAFFSGFSPTADLPERFTEKLRDLVALAKEKTQQKALKQLERERRLFLARPSFKKLPGADQNSLQSFFDVEIENINQSVQQRVQGTKDAEAAFLESQ